MQAADTCCFTAKEAGRNRWHTWGEGKTIDVLAEQPHLELIEHICLNGSGQSVVDPSFLQTVDHLLAESGPQISGLLCFEITETAAITSVAAAMEFIAIVRRHGCTVALDDFGSGMASFGALKNLPVTHLKIDGQFVTGVIDDPLDDVAVRCFVEVAEVIGLRTMAEFVESAPVLERLRQIGVHDAQGYHLHRPEPFDAVMAEAMANRTGWTKGLEPRQAHESLALRCTVVLHATLRCDFRRPFGAHRPTTWQAAGTN